jgi:hypothetical protein
LHRSGEDFGFGTRRGGGDALEPRPGIEPFERLPRVPEQRLGIIGPPASREPLAVLELYDREMEGKPDSPELRFRGGEVAVGTRIVPTKVRAEALRSCTVKGRAEPGGRASTICSSSFIFAWSSRARAASSPWRKPSFAL